MDEVIEILRGMYRQQHETDEAGEREVAAWYALEALEAACGTWLFQDE